VLETAATMNAGLTYSPPLPGVAALNNYVEDG